MRAVEVFTPGKLPDVTYIDDHLKDRARLLHDALEMGAAVVSLSGPSKSGKTVFIEKNIGKDRLIQVTGAGVNSPGKLWDRVFDLIGTPIGKRSTESSGFQGGIAGKVTAEAGVLVSAKAEVGASGTWSQDASSGGCKNFCVNGHLAGDCRTSRENRNDRKQRTDRQPAG